MRRHTCMLLAILAAAVLLFATAVSASDALTDLRRQAEDGDAEAQFTLGLTYATGQGVPQDYRAAAAWIRKSAEQGKDYAQDYLGTMYEEGKGVPRDYAIAADFYLKAANMGNANAQEHLGQLYTFGRGTPQNFVIAYMWLSLAASKGNARAVMLRTELERLMPPADINAARKLAEEWQPFP